MKRKDAVNKGLAIVGTVLVWLPVLAPVLLGLAAYIAGRTFLFDYLMPAELFLLVLVGGGLLTWVAVQTHLHGKLIGGGLATAVVALMLCQGLAVWTGLASGDIEPEGWPLIVVMTCLGVYITAVLVVGVGGIWLLRDL